MHEELPDRVGMRRGAPSPLESLNSLGREVRILAQEYKSLIGQKPQSSSIYGGLQVLRQSLLRSLEAVEELLSGEERRADQEQDQEQEVLRSVVRPQALRSKAENRNLSDRAAALILGCLSDGQAKYAREIQPALRKSGLQLDSYQFGYQAKRLAAKGKIRMLPNRQWVLAPG